MVFDDYLVESERSRDRKKLLRGVFATEGLIDPVNVSLREELLQHKLHGLRFEDPLASYSMSIIEAEIQYDLERKRNEGALNGTSLFLLKLILDHKQKLVSLIPPTPVKDANSWVVARSKKKKALPGLSSSNSSSSSSSSSESSSSSIKE